MTNIDQSVTHDCYATAMSAYRDSALTDIKNMTPINTERAIQRAVDAALDVYIKSNLTAKAS
jgi:hypothetical protein